MNDKGLDLCKRVYLSVNFDCILQHVQSNLFVKVAENGRIGMSEGHEGDQCK